MATIADILSVQQREKLKIYTKETNIETNANNVSLKACELLYDIATRIGRKLNNSFYAKLNSELNYNDEVIVCLKGVNDCEIIRVIKHNAFAKHIGEMLKQRYVMVWIGENFATEINWDNWTRIYKQLTSTPVKKQQTYDPEMTKNQQRTIAINRRKEAEFYDIAKVNRKNKPNMRISVTEAHNQRVRMAKDNYKSEIYLQANRIFAVL